MQHTEFIKALAQEENLSITDSKAIVEMVFNTIKKVLLDGEDDLLINNFGKFSVKMTKARMGRNPKTGESLEIKAHNKLVFKPSASFKQSIKG